MAGVRALVGAELRAFHRYIVRPRARIREARIGTPLQRCLIALGGLLVLDSLVVFPVYVVTTWLGMSNANADLSGWNFFFLGVLFAPILEECVFRGGLRSPRYSIFIGPTLIILVGAHSFAVLKIATAVACAEAVGACALSWRLRRSPTSATGLQRQYARRFPVAFYGYASAFAIVHASNWDTPVVEGWLVLPLLVLPQFSLGIVAGYLRIRDSLQSAILLHMALNSIGLALGLAFA